MVKSSKRILKKLFKGLPTMVEHRRKFLFLNHLKCLFRYSENTSFPKKINTGLETTSSQSLILLRKNTPVNYLYKGEETLLTWSYFKTSNDSLNF